MNRKTSRGLRPLARSLSGRRPRIAAATLLVAGLAALGAVRAAAVSISPVAVYLDDRSPTGTMTLYNPGTRPEEIRIEFGFGYPKSDEDGNVAVAVTPDAPEGEPSAVPWLRAFPQRLVLPPGGRQVVRIMANPPRGLATGEYWARALVRSRGGQAPIESKEGDVGVMIEFETVLVVAVNFRNGAVNTGLGVRHFEAGMSGDTLVASVDLERQGNAAFLGRLLVEALDDDGRVVASREEILAVYRTLHRRVAVRLPEGTTARRVRFVMDSNHDGLPPGGPLPSEPVAFEVPVS